MRLSKMFSKGRSLSSLTEAEIVALAISAEEEDAHIYRSFAQKLRESFPATAAIYDEMAQEEDGHRAQLLALYQSRFGDEMPLIRREHVDGFPRLKPVWLLEYVSLDTARNFAQEMEQRAEAFYMAALRNVTDAQTRALLGDLAAAEMAHRDKARTAEAAHVPPDVRRSEDDEAHRKFVLTWVQPGLAGLMDGSVSTLAPIFATAFATQDTWTTFLVGVAASVGAGISMGFTEAASDDGEISGRGSPIKRGIASGVMTTIGGLGHALPYLIPEFWVATAIAIVVVFVELWAIAWIQKTYMKTPFWRAAFQVVLGGALVLGAGILIGSG